MRAPKGTTVPSFEDIEERRKQAKWLREQVIRELLACTCTFPLVAKHVVGCPTTELKTEEKK